MSLPTFLMIGATGRMGLALIRAAASHPERPAIHAFCRTPSKFSAEDAKLCASIQTGDARSSEDIEKALRETQADVVLVSVGIPNSAAPSDIREKSALALETALQKDEFSHVRVVVMSVCGAGGSKLEYGWGVGMLARWLLRHGIRDHDRQEEILGGLEKRCWIVRPMGLGEGEGGGVVMFEGKAKALMVQRRDLAEWIVERVLEGGLWGQAVNVTGGDAGNWTGVFEQMGFALKTQ